MNEKPEALKLADAMLLQIEENIALRRQNEQLRQRYRMEQEIFKGGMYELRSLLTEVRGAKWLVVQNNLLDRIDAALRREEV